MVLTVTLNPLLERRLSYYSISWGGVNRSGVLKYFAGGKGINVSRQLNEFNVDNLAFTFIGGSNGKIFNDVIHDEKIKFAAVRIKSDTRTAAIILDQSQNNITSFFDPDPEITSSEADEFLAKLEKMIPNFDVIVLSGSSPENTGHIFPAAIKIAAKYDKVSVCDTYGAHLSECIDAGPTIMHNNITEIENSLGINVGSEKDKTDFLRLLYSKKVRQAFLTDGGNSFYCSNFDFTFKVKNPAVKAVDPTGSGDAFTAGIIYGWQNNFTFEEMLSFAASAGALNALDFNVCGVKINEIEKLAKEVVISPIGKKMKLIDVTPQ